MHAADRSAANEALVRSGLFATTIREDTAILIGRRHGTRDLAVGLRLLGELLASGVAVRQALSTMTDAGPRIWQESAPDMGRMVEDGAPLSQVLTITPLRVPPYIVAIVQAGEAGGTLCDALEIAAVTLEESAAVRKAITAALAYPAVLMTTGIATLVLVTTVVLPRLVRTFVDMGQELPFLAATALQAANLIVPGLELLALFMLVALLANALRPRPQPRLALLFTAPLVRQIRSCHQSNRVMSLLGNLLGAGVHLPMAIAAAANATGDSSLEQRMNAVHTRILSGASLSSSLEAERVITPMAVQFVRVGEQTGRLAEMIRQASRLDALEANERLVKLIRVLEPALIVLIGAVVLLIALMLTQVMYGLRIT